jgi:hypothetical protein
MRGDIWEKETQNSYLNCFMVPFHQTEKLFGVVPDNANLEIRFRGSLLYLTRSQTTRNAIRVSLDWSTTCTYGGPLIRTSRFRLSADHWTFPS